MYIYIVYRTDTVSYEEYRSMVVLAETEDEAIELALAEGIQGSFEENHNRQYLSVNKIGIAFTNQKAGVIHKDYTGS